MSVIVKGMEMPKNCAECRLWSICECLNDFEDYVSIVEAVDDGCLVRDDNCPLTEVKDRPRDSNGRFSNGINDDKGCMGCAYVGLKESDEPCVRCSKCYKNRYQPKKKDDEIKVGDEVEWDTELIVVTRLYMEGGFKWCDGISKDGIAFRVLEENVSKTNRHFDIAKILEEMET